MAINKPANYENVKAATERVALPAGGYVCRVVTAKVATFDKKDGSGSFSRLEVALDIDEGDFAYYYRDDFDAQRGEDKKWKGVLRQYLPAGDGTEKDEWTTSKLKAMIEAFEDSNAGFHFNWDDEKCLAGKLVGVVFRNEQWVMGSRSGWKAQPFKAIPVDAVRTGKFKMPADLPNKNAPVSIDLVPGTDGFAEVSSDEGDLPF